MGEEKERGVSDQCDVIGRMLREDENEFTQGCLGKKITDIEIVDDALMLEFQDSEWLRLLDDAQFCCESRYMSTDDVFKDYTGGYLLGIRVQDAPDIDDPVSNAHECQFLVIKTTKGEFTIVNHNQHNGYYGGFNLKSYANLNEKGDPNNDYQKV